MCPSYGPECAAASSGQDPHAAPGEVVPGIEIVCRTGKAAHTSVTLVSTVCHAETAAATSHVFFSAGFPHMGYEVSCVVHGSHWLEIHKQKAEVIILRC